MQFTATINTLETFEINYGVDRHGDIDLENVEIFDMDLEPVEPDKFSDEDWATVEELCKADYLAAQIDRASGLEWD